MSQYISSYISRLYVKWSNKQRRRYYEKRKGNKYFSAGMFFNPMIVSCLYNSVLSRIRFSSQLSRSRILSVIIVIAAEVSRIDTRDLVVPGLGLTFCLPRRPERGHLEFTVMPGHAITRAHVPTALQVGSHRRSELFAP